TQRAGWPGGHSPPDPARIAPGAYKDRHLLESSTTVGSGQHLRAQYARDWGAAAPTPACPSGQASVPPLAAMNRGGSPFGLARPSAAVRGAPAPERMERMDRNDGDGRQAPSTRPGPLTAAVSAPTGDAVELYHRTYTTLLRSTGEMRLRVFEASHKAMRSSLHPLAASPELDLGAFLYASRRLP